MNPWVIVAALVTAIALGAGGYAKGRTDANAKWQIEIAKQAEAGRQKEQQLQEETNAIVSNLNVEKDAINARLNDALERLRQRPERLPEPARVTCEGATGSELSGPDAGFLEREAARADQLRAALQAAYEYIDALERK